MVVLFVVKLTIGAYKLQNFINKDKIISSYKLKLTYHVTWSKQITIVVSYNYSDLQVWLSSYFVLM